ncbi:YbjN domain-containing protein [Corynebacterium afermentans subsp. lipophilum]|nr:YbjN domain-containing protein [Corynebacterium afermentans subsp. lipophilum]
MTEKVTPESIAAIFEEENLEYRIEDQVVRSGFVNAAIVVAIDGDHLVFEALWRGEFPREMAPKVLYACNEHNQTHFAPTLRFFERGEDRLAISAIRSMRVAEGASFNQLGAFIVSSIDATLQAFDFLKNTFPTVVTWEEPQ